MKRLSLIVAALVLTALFVISAPAQKKSRSASKKPVPQKPLLPPLEVRAAREKVDIQLSNVREFERKLGTFAQDLEVADADAKAGRLRPSTAAAIATNKSNVVLAIRNIRDGLLPLESEFRTKTALQKYLPSLEGITGLASEAEDLALAGRFVASKDPLRQVVQKLTDALAILPR